MSLDLCRTSRFYSSRVNTSQVQAELDRASSIQATIFKKSKTGKIWFLKNLIKFFFYKLCTSHASHVITAEPNTSRAGTRAFCFVCRLVLTLIEACRCSCSLKARQNSARPITSSYHALKVNLIWDMSLYTLKVDSLFKIMLFE